MKIAASLVQMVRRFVVNSQKREEDNKNSEPFFLAEQFLISVGETTVHMMQDQIF